MTTTATVTICPAELLDRYYIVGPNGKPMGATVDDKYLTDHGLPIPPANPDALLLTQLRATEQAATDSQTANVLMRAIERIEQTTPKITVTAEPREGAIVLDLDGDHHKRFSDGWHLWDEVTGWEDNTPWTWERLTTVCGSLTLVEDGD